MRVPSGRFPHPPAFPRRGPLREGAFPSRLHDPRVAALLGIWLGIAFGVCFLTGLVSHFMQHPPSFLDWPSRPVWLYRATQGLHVATGLATVPLLLAKLWTVYPRLWEWPPVRSAAHALERLTIVPLIAGAVFQLATGIANTAQWYRFRFFFTVTHYWVAWMTVGALLVHVAVKLAVVRANVGSGRAGRAHLTDRRSAPEPAGEGLSRRGLGVAVGTAAGVITLTTAGQFVPGLARLDLLAPRRPDLGPQGLPVNRTAAAARVITVARDPNYRLEVVGPRPFTLSLAELRAFDHHTSKLPITCVEGWAADATWRGPRLRDLLDAAGIPPGATVRVESLESRGGYRASEVNPPHARDPLTLLATGLNGAVLDLDHGYPARLIAPNRPGVLQTKWVHRVVML
ncbi:molybdopterin-dependent oxidoreductase [Frankia sp. CNm7]|uniref:Molybdopterin-dependent oxidoreductase n=1 Tax=Frankia nepalensis TaxID=1836974 RepID=A0A937RIE8_9ACTN|nr:molybdopterin-dependent oxidoreductase [Frankia nepalensis]MBL7498966.1 molybdopterin-dependent oxidoreductase [Frankia nepalensis]MBL7511514.1 molybdopterin-dependent oxidoreductase [Frankia nepalensis]MBL7520730.1 molybdopterin-dependent oxidoreductase [Frankia nepalensis]MBL7630757.1 molybdopterin-dependent oxidoreductase [Frankia nepalensis]